MHLDGNNMMKDLEDFHTKFGLEGNAHPGSLNSELQAFRNKFIGEELDEYLKAVYTNDLEGMLDGLVDLTYVVLGTAYLHGFDFNEAWRRVHAANMKKQRVEKASDSKRDSEYDVIKPKGWEPANLTDLVGR
jgi:predicted HAD superfamily Cof-like phosphohydrolase